MVRKVKNGTCTAHFVEMMACPSGCPNGGGQLPGGDVGVVRSVMDQATFRPAEQDAAALQAFYVQVVGGGPESTRARELLHGQFHAVAKLDENSAVAPEW